jgi:hypothetical protein
MGMEAADLRDCGAGFRTSNRIDARRRNAGPFPPRHSQSVASRRHRSAAATHSDPSTRGRAQDAQTNRRARCWEGAFSSLDSPSTNSSGFGNSDPRRIQGRLHRAAGLWSVDGPDRVQRSCVRRRAAHSGSEDTEEGRHRDITSVAVVVGALVRLLGFTIVVPPYGVSLKGARR